MTSPIYRQGDSRWSGIKYPSSPYTIGRSGCGLMSVLHAVIEQPKYATYKPKNIVGYMRQYATRGNGTKWVGIKKGLEHYGYDVKQLSANTMAPVWKELAKGDQIGVIRMVSGKRGGIRWTSSGHYIFFQAYKVKNNKHYFKIKDSGGRHNDGWFCYEDHMRGMFGPIWIAKRKDPDVVNKCPYTGTIPTTTIKNGSKGEAVKQWQRFLNHVYGDVLVEDGKFGLKSDSYTACFQVYCDITEDSIVGRNTQKYANRWGK